MRRRAAIDGGAPGDEAPSPLRAPRFGKDVEPSRDLRERPELCLLPVDQLVVDPRYQRAIGSRGVTNIKRILERFDWRKFQPVVVTRLDDGRYAIIDGQHRATAALLHPAIDLVPCMIVKATPQEADECFAAINGCVTEVNAVHLFHARLAAGDETARIVAEACAAAGCAISRHLVQRRLLKPGQTLAVVAIQNALKTHGREIVIAALKALRSTRDGKASLVCAPLVTALSAVLARNPLWAQAGDSLVEAARKRNLERLLDGAAAEARRKETSQAVVIEAQIERMLGAALGPGVAARVKSEVAA